MPKATLKQSTLPWATGNPKVPETEAEKKKKKKKDTGSTRSQLQETLKAAGYSTSGYAAATTLFKFKPNEVGYVMHDGITLNQTFLKAACGLVTAIGSDDASLELLYEANFTEAFRAKAAGFVAGAKNRTNKQSPQNVKAVKSRKLFLLTLESLDFEQV